MDTDLSFTCSFPRQRAILVAAMLVEKGIPFKVSEPNLYGDHLFSTPYDCQDIMQQFLRVLGARPGEHKAFAFELDAERLASIMSKCINEGASSYWVKKLNAHGMQTGAWYVEPDFYQGTFLIFVLDPELNSMEFTWDAVRRGLEVMRMEYTGLYSKMVSGDFDGDLADKFLQISLYGRVKWAQPKLYHPLTQQLLADLFITCVEGGSNYWLDSFLPESEVPPSDQNWYENPQFYHDKFEIRVTHEEGSVLINWDAVQKGLMEMLLKYPKHYGDLISENWDAETADVFLQMVALGDIVYG